MSKGSSGALALGYNLVVTGWEPKSIDWGLGGGSNDPRALVWLNGIGTDGTCPTAAGLTEFKRVVDAARNHPRVFGYLLRHQASSATCPALADRLRERADYIRETTPGHLSFVHLGVSACPGDPSCIPRDLKPATTHVDLFGITVFPCSAQGGCRFDWIEKTVNTAAANGIPKAAMVPVYQVFGSAPCGGGKGYAMPSEEQLRAMLAAWRKALPGPMLEYTQSWENGADACPTLVDANGTNGRPNLQAVMKAHNSR